jgi:NAD(P)-dependent dehydrogenase (short-subunit alcohol dehydrogenase family)
MSSTKQKVVIVTGASQGIGEAIAESYMAHGYCVVANSRSIAKDRFSSPNVVAVAGDIALPETADTLLQTAIEHFGRVDTLINNAGIYLPKPFIEYTTEDYATLVGINLTGFFHLTQKVIRQLLQQKSGGHICSITATIAEHPLRAEPALLSSMTKGGLNAATRALAIEYADRNIRVNAVAPGVIRTPLSSKVPPEAVSKIHPIPRLGEAKEIADAVLYLEGAEFVTGEILHVDGGAHSGHW